MRKSILLMRMLSGLFRLLGYALSHWKLALLVALFVSPVTPYMRWEYRYNDIYGRRIYMDCTYLGIGGIIMPDYVEHCPFIILLDRNGGQE